MAHLAAEAVLRKVVAVEFAHAVGQSRRHGGVDRCPLGGGVSHRQVYGAVVERVGAESTGQAGRSEAGQVRHRRALLPRQSLDRDKMVSGRGGKAGSISLIK